MYLHSIVHVMKDLQCTKDWITFLKTCTSDMTGENKHTNLDILLFNPFVLCIVVSLIPYVLSGEYKICDNVGTFQHFMDFPWTRCSEECARRKRCKIFMFRKDINYCTLKDNIHIASLDNRRPICGYFERNEGIQVDFGPCRGKPCDETERCNSKTKNEYECLKTECPAPNQIENAKLLSKTYGIGTTNRYKCINGLVGRGSTSIVCMKNGTWSKTDFKCVLPPMACPELKSIYFNSILTNVDNVGYVGTVLTYACRNGYNKRTDKIKITCLKSGDWSSKKIACCNDNSTVIIDGFCRVTVNGGLVSSRNEASKFCKRIGGYLSWAKLEANQMFNKTTTRFVLHAELKSTVDKRMKIDVCAAKNGVVADPTWTFDEKINKIREENWLGYECFWGKRFIQGQLDGGDAEPCLVRDLQQNFHHWDMPCTFQKKNVGFMCYFKTPIIQP